MKYGVIGSGNLASHLVKAMTEAGYPPAFILSRNNITGGRLSRKSGAPFVDTLPAAGRSTPLLLICTKDDSIPTLFKHYERSGYILVHFSGGLPLIKTGKACMGSGVMWPVQTLSKASRLNWKKIPLCLESSNKLTLRRLRALARILGGPVNELNSNQRAKVHLAAVFANNFTNAQFTMAKELLEKQGIEFDLLKPLITQTANAVLRSSPERLQTGPAQRGDMDVIRKHLSMLEDDPEIKATYMAVTDFLLKKYNH